MLGTRRLLAHHKEQTTHTTRPHHMCHDHMCLFYMLAILSRVDAAVAAEQSTADPMQPSLAPFRKPNTANTLSKHISQQLQHIGCICFSELYYKAQQAAAATIKGSQHVTAHTHTDQLCCSLPQKQLQQVPRCWWLRTAALRLAAACAVALGSITLLLLLPLPAILPLLLLPPLLCKPIPGARLPRQPVICCFCLQQAKAKHSVLARGSQVLCCLFNSAAYCV